MQQLSAQNRELVNILIQVDALWIPIRDWQGYGCDSIWQRRLAYPAHGHYWHRGDDGTDRRDSNRQREALADQRLIETIRKRGGRSTGIKLTDNGEATARALCHLPSLADSISFLEEIVDDGFEVSFLGGYIKEEFLAGTGARSRKDREVRQRLVKLEMAVLPCLVRGWIESNSDSHGHVSYKATKEGIKALDMPAPTAPTIEPSEEAWHLYDSAIIDAVNTRNEWTRLNGHEVAIPLPINVFDNRNLGIFEPEETQCESQT